jgi:polar amino acid transport system substrate-binding protein
VAVPTSRRLTLAALPALSLPGTSSAAPPQAPLTLVSSDLPPMTTPGAPGQRGVLMDLVEAMLKLAEMPAQPEFFPWARAMLLAAERPRTLIVPLNRTPDREARFQWLVKLYAQRFAFITLASQPRVQTLAQARRLRITGLRGSSNLDTLQQQRVPPGNIYPSASVSDMQRALERGLVDAMYGSELIHTDTWRRNGRDPAQLQTGLVLESAGIWLAAQGGITEAEQARLKQAQDMLLANGSTERIFKHYGLKPRAEDLR